MQARQLVLTQRVLVAAGRAFDALGEPLVELRVRVEECGHDEVQERPQLRHRVLDGRAREKQAVATVEPQQGLPAVAAAVLQGLGLVQHEVLPLDGPEVLLVRHQELVRRKHNLEVAVVAVQLLVVQPPAQRLALRHVAPVRQQLKVGHEVADLILPVVQRGRRAHHKEGSADVLLFGEVSQKHQRLHRLSETHLVREDAVQTLLVQVHQPLQALELVVFEGTREHPGLRDVRVVRLRRRLHRHLRWCGASHSAVRRALAVKLLPPTSRRINRRLRLHLRFLARRLLFLWGQPEIRVRVEQLVPRRVPRHAHLAGHEMRVQLRL
mmetsp:Transcript_2519/g.4692  ORF Transcript_2519/g.4692 Transcript_2519/m.4692 type:complete len:324 (+) Transcript_2519:2313-3284(+)